MTLNVKILVLLTQKANSFIIRALFDCFKLHFPAKRFMHAETTEFIQVASLFHSLYRLCYPIIIHIIKTNLKVLCSVKLHFPAHRACSQIVVQKLFCSLEVLHSCLCVWRVETPPLTDSWRNYLLT